MKLQLYKFNKLLCATIALVFIVGNLFSAGIEFVPKPVAYWPMDGEATEEIAGADGVWKNTNTSGLTWEDSKIGKGAALNGGANNYFAVQSDPLAGATALSISVWVKVEETAVYKGIVFSRADDNSSNNWGIGKSDSRFDGRIASAAGYTEAIIKKSQWHHAVLTWENTGIRKFYVDNVKVWDEDSAATTYVSNGDWELGTDIFLSSRVFFGTMDEIIMFDKALSVEEINLLYTKGNAGIPLSNYMERDEADILSFELAEQVQPAEIDYDSARIRIKVAEGTDLSALTPTIGLVGGASIDPGSGITRDFTDKVSYTVTASGGVTRVWQVHVYTKLKGGANILSFDINKPTLNNGLDTTFSTVAFQVVNGTDVTALVPDITISEGASITPASGFAQDFTNPVKYKVTAENGTIKEWTVVCLFGEGTSGIQEMVNAGIGVYPVPFSETLNIKTQEPVSVSIFTMVGVLVETHTLHSEGALNVSHLSSGGYILRIKPLESGKNYIVKVFK